MRRTLLVFGLALAMTATIANDAFAQRWGRGRGAYNSGRYYDRGYGYGYGRGYGLGVGVWPGYYYGSGYLYGPGYVAGSPDYYYPDPGVQLAPTDVRQSYYPSSINATATVTVLVPAPNAQVWFNGAATSQQGIQRTFSTPALEQGYTYTYTIKARWMENGRPIDQERQVNIRSGQPVTVDFRGNSSERLGTPNSAPNP